MNKNKTIIIAEAGVNHNGDIKIAKKLIDVAESSGADFVKFQTFNSVELVTQNAKKAKYQKHINDDNESQIQMLKKLELNKENHIILYNYCKNKKIQFISTAFDLKSIDFLDRFDMPFFKIPSGEITNLPYLRHIASKKKPILMSSGMSTMQEIRDALFALENSGVNKGDISVLHCNSEYPTEMIDVNLKAMLTIKSELNVDVGYSDHTLGIEVPIAAVALGAKVIEKHFTLDRNLPGPDHSASLIPKELNEMVSGIRNIENALGNDVKEPSPSELINIKNVRKSIVAKTSIKKGTKFSEKNLTVKRPAVGISPMEWDEIIGQVSSADFNPDDLIKL